MRFGLSRLFVTFAILLVSVQTALAQPDPLDPSGAPAPPPDPTTAPPPPPPPPPGPTPAGTDVVPDKRVVGPVLPNMLPARIGATVDIRGDYSHSDEGFLGSDLFLIGFNFFGSYITPGGLGGYAQFPYYYASISGDGEDVSEKGIGNLEVGGLYRIPQGESSLILLRGGIALDTAGMAGGILAPFSQIGPRFYDAYPTGFQSMWGRAEGSFRHTAGNLVLGVSGGVDVPFNSDDESGIDNFDGLAKVAVSAGFVSGTATVAIGLVNLTAIGTDSDDDNITGANATVSFDINPSVALYGAFGYPDLEENELDIFGFGVGVRIAAN